MRLVWHSDTHGKLDDICPNASVDSLRESQAGCSSKHPLITMELAALQNLARSVAEARPPDSVLQELVRGLGMTEGVALARVWLLEPASNGSGVLRLQASVGYSLAQPDVRWTRTDGGHQVLPITGDKVGRIAASGSPLLLQRGCPDWTLDPEWTTQERIESFAGQPLSYAHETLGVVAVFSRGRLELTDLKWLRVFADQAAVALAAARGRDELERLRIRLDRERTPSAGSEDRAQAAPRLERSQVSQLDNADKVISEGEWRELERRNIIKALRLSDGKVAGANGAAARLGLKPSTLTYRMQSLGIQRSLRSRTASPRS